MREEAVVVVSVSENLGIRVRVCGGGFEEEKG